MNMTKPESRDAVAGTVEPTVGLQPNGLDVRAVDPRNGAKYSPNLHKWLTMRSKTHHAWTSRVYRDDAGTLWIGMLDLGDLIGARLMNVLCYGTKAESCCWVNLRGLVEVAEGTQGEKHALIFGRNGTGEIGEPTQPDRVATHEETLAVVTFANVASLDVVVGKLQQLRAKMLPDNAVMTGPQAPSP